MKVLVTGGAGFIGSHIVDALVARGDEVVVLDDLSTGRRENLAAAGDAAKLIVGDVGDRDTVMRAAEGCGLIFHEAAIASVQRTVEAPIQTNAVNVGGTLNVLEAARAHGTKRVVFAGSSAVYGDNPSLPLSEEALPRPMSPYAVEKLASERYMTVWSGVFGVEAVTLRYFNVFGPRQDPSSPYSGVISIFADRLLRGEGAMIFGDGEQTRDFVFVADVVQANLAAASVAEANGGVFNIGRGSQTTIAELYEMIRERVGGGPAATLAEPRAGDIKHSLADIGRARSMLGFEPKVSVGDGLGMLLDYERSQR
jgi:UDP-glucose 4-epimerase